MPAWASDASVSDDDGPDNHGSTDDVAAVYDDDYCGTINDDYVYDATDVHLPAIDLDLIDFIHDLDLIDFIHLHDSLIHGPADHLEHDDDVDGSAD